MRLPWRRRTLPAARRPPLAAGERVVAWAGTPRDEVVVATNLGLWLPGRDSRIGWHEINKAVWSGRQLTVTAWRPAPGAGPAGDGGAPGAGPAGDGGGGPGTGGEGPDGGYAVVTDLPPVTVTLLDPGDVPDQVRARITRSVGYSAHHALPGGGVRVVGRRQAGRDGLRWMVRYDDGGSGSPDTRATVDDLVAGARASIPQPD